MLRELIVNGAAKVGAQIRTRCMSWLVESETLVRVEGRPDAAQPAAFGAIGSYRRARQHTGGM